MAALNTASKPRLARKARLRYEEVRKTELLLLPERVVKLNPSAAAILRLCNGGRTVGDIIVELEARYSKSGLQSEVMEFLRRVSEQGWVEFYE
jgi:pyrroloquinoline quinone biosynthesis protein D